MKNFFYKSCFFWIRDFKSVKKNFFIFFAIEKKSTKIFSFKFTFFGEFCKLIALTKLGTIKTFDENHYSMSRLALDQLCSKTLKVSHFHWIEYFSLLLVQPAVILENDSVAKLTDYFLSGGKFFPPNMIFFRNQQS